MMSSASVRVGSPWPWFADYGNWLFRTRNTVFPLVMLVLFLGFKPRLAGGSLQSDSWLDWLGFSIAVSGQLLRAAVIGYAYIKRGGLNKKVHADTLVTEGFFNHARNPLYDGNLLILAGLFVIHNNPWVYFIGGIFFVTAYLAIVAAEEAFLAGKFGPEYLDYCARVNRWWPRLAGLSATMQGMEFNWRRVVIKDYASAATWMLMALLLVALERFVYARESFSLQSCRPLILAGAVLLALVALVRVLKKRKLLRE
jgi:protein-S-isoprenylcysteine O-methyltransferase Ste14